METIPLLFNQTLESVRRMGARGGKACARNRRARQNAAAQVTAPSISVIVVPVESTTRAIARLDAKFPWLQAAKRRSATRP